MPKITSKTSSRPALRTEHAENTRKALVRAARVEFAQSGYEGASLEAIVGRARVTKGALYHHFPGGKLGLFLAVFEALEQELVARVGEAAAAAGDDLWQQIDAALWAFVRHSAHPEYLRIVLQDGPHLIGMKQQREIDQGQAVQLIEALMRALVDGGQIPALPLPVLSRVWLGALTEGAQSIAQSEDRAAAIEAVHHVIWTLLQGLRRMA